MHIIYFVQISMNVSVAVLSVITMLHALTLMAVISVPVTLDSLEMDSIALVRWSLKVVLPYKYIITLLYMLQYILPLHCANHYGHM